MQRASRAVPPLELLFGGDAHGGAQSLAAPECFARSYPGWGDQRHGSVDQESPCATHTRSSTAAVFEWTHRAERATRANGAVARAGAGAGRLRVCQPFEQPGNTALSLERPGRVARRSSGGGPARQAASSQSQLPRKPRYRRGPTTATNERSPVAAISQRRNGVLRRATGSGFPAGRGADAAAPRKSSVGAGAVRRGRRKRLVRDIGIPLRDV